jgi:hypothetical protein
VTSAEDSLFSFPNPVNEVSARLVAGGVLVMSILTLERCESGRIGLTANELTWVTGSEGSNPSLSARVSGTWCRTIRMAWPAQAGLPRPSPRRDRPGARSV